jgi:hypothetical protein
MQKPDIVSALQSNICDVKFTKVNGEERLMRCTLKEDLLPEPVASDTEINRNRKPNESVQVVWDLEKTAWRSFRIDSVINIQTVML